MIDLTVINVEINRQNSYVWKFQVNVLNNQWIKEKILKEIRKYLEVSNNENILYQKRP